MSLPETLPHTCRITQSVNVPDEFAADFDGPVVVSDNIPCWVQPVTDREEIAHDRRSQYVTNKVYFSTDPGIKPGYFVEPYDGPSAGKSLEVKSAAECTAGTGLLWRAFVEDKTSHI